MKILNFDTYISEKKSISPLTVKQIKSLKLNDYLVKPGDRLEDGDMVLVACENLKNPSDIELQYGVYRISYVWSYISYANHASLEFNNIKQNYEYTYNNAYTHYILKIYRPIDETHRLTLTKNKEKSIEKVESSPYYQCIYKNEELCDKFGV